MGILVKSYFIQGGTVMKKWIALLLALTMVMSLCAFAGAEGTTTLTVAY